MIPAISAGIEVPPERDQPPAGEDRQRRHARPAVDVPAVRDPPRVARHPRARQPGDREQPDHRLAVAVVLREQERHRRPQPAERRHPEQPEHHPPAQHGLLAHERPDRPQQPRVGAPSPAASGAAARAAGRAPARASRPPRSRRSAASRRAAATIPLIVRASRIPSSNPLITRPTTRPRSFSPASVEANGTRICAAQLVRPTSASAIARTPNDGAAAAIASASASAAISLGMSLRRCSRSPSGTINSNPVT